MTNLFAAPGPVPPSTEAAAEDSTPAATPGANLADLIDQVHGQLGNALASGEHHVVLHLRPPELGDLNVRLLVSGREVSAWFDSPQPAVHQVLSQGLSQLQSGLANAGYDLNNAWIGGDAWRPRERNGPLPPRPGREAPAAHSDPARLTISRTSGPGVSVYV